MEGEKGVKERIHYTITLSGGGALLQRSFNLQTLGRKRGELAKISEVDL